MSAGQLRQALLDAGLKVREYGGWRTRGFAWSVGKPVGVMQHHTAPPVPFPLAKLAGETDGRLKCNINIKPDATVWLVAYRACNFSSGNGSNVVLDETRRRIAPSGLAINRNLSDNVNGNPWYWNFENDHPGDGSPIPQAQYDAIIITNRVVNEHFGLVPNQTIAHAEWTRRKIDPKWNSQNAHQVLNVIRNLLKEDDELTEQDRRMLQAIFFGLGLEWKDDLGWVLRHTNSNLSHYLRGVLPADIVAKVGNIETPTLQAIAKAVNDELKKRL